jgi:hypothetical protein
MEQKIQIDANKVIDDLTMQIANLVREIAILRVQVNELMKEKKKG